MMASHRWSGVAWIIDQGKQSEVPNRGGTPGPGAPWGGSWI